MFEVVLGTPRFGQKYSWTDLESENGLQGQTKKRGEFRNKVLCISMDKFFMQSSNSKSEKFSQETYRHETKTHLPNYFMRKVFSHLKFKYFLCPRHFSVKWCHVQFSRSWFDIASYGKTNQVSVECWSKTMYTYATYIISIHLRSRRLWQPSNDSPPSQTEAFLSRCQTFKSFDCLGLKFQMEKIFTFAKTIRHTLNSSRVSFTLGKCI